MAKYCRHTAARWWRHSSTLARTCRGSVIGPIISMWISADEWDLYMDGCCCIAVDCLISLRWCSSRQEDLCSTIVCNFVRMQLAMCQLKWRRKVELTAVGYCCWLPLCRSGVRRQRRAFMPEHFNACMHARKRWSRNYCYYYRQRQRKKEEIETTIHSQDVAWDQCWDKY